MNIINLAQGSQAWLDWRMGGITATDAAVLLGLNPNKTQWRLWAEKVGFAVEEDLSGNPHVQRGKALEDQARRLFEEKHNDLLLPICAESADYPLLRASFDGINAAGEPVELKCPSEKNFAAVVEQREASEPFQRYIPQVQHQIYVSGADRGYLVFFHDGEIEEFVVERDDILINEILVEAKAFWKLVETKTEPAQDADRDIFIPRDEAAMSWIASAEELHGIEAEIVELKARLKALEADKAPLLDELKGMMGTFRQADYAGVSLTRYLPKGTVDTDRMATEAGLDVEQYRRPAKERWRVTVTPKKIEPKKVDIVDADVLAPLKEFDAESAQFFF